MFGLFKLIFRLIRFLLGVILWCALFLFIGYIALCITFPVKYMDIIEKYSDKYDLEPEFVCAVINTESHFNEDVESEKGATGLMQIMPDTAQWAVKQMGYEDFDFRDINKPEVNIKIGCWILDFLLKQFNGDRELAAAAYNAGIGNVKKWLESTNYSYNGESLHSIPYGETQRYVKKIDLYTKVYRIILGTDLYEIKIF